MSHSNEEQFHLMVPRRLDDTQKVLFWDFDTAIVFLGVLFVGIMAGYLLTSMAAGVALAAAVQKMKSGQRRGYMLHVLYWHLPWNVFKRTPPSCIREFVG